MLAHQCQNFTSSWTRGRRRNRERNKEEREKKEACGGKRGTEREK